ncbi:MAG: DUF6249 domain-containing protein [Paludibacter sp.]|nr:DUF6249 domain-containing protein [Paludibacter sp.]
MKRIELFLIALAMIVGANAAHSTVDIDSLKNAIIQNSKEIQEQRKDSIMYSKLSADQILELKKAELDVQREKAEVFSRNDMPFSSSQLFLIVLLPFLFVATIVYITSKAKKDESKRRYDLYSKSLEMGQSIPEHFFDEPKKANGSSNIKKGILWLVVGLALLIYFIIMHKNNALIAGIIPTFVGIGYLLVHILDKPKAELTEKKDEQHG